VWPLSDLAASAIVPATSAKFSGAEKTDVVEIVSGARGVKADDGNVNPDATDRTDAVTVKAVNDFMLVVVYWFLFCDLAYPNCRRCRLK